MQSVHAVTRLEIDSVRLRVFNEVPSIKLQGDAVDQGARALHGDLEAAARGEKYIMIVSTLGFAFWLFIAFALGAWAL